MRHRALHAAGSCLEREGLAASGLGDLVLLLTLQQRMLLLLLLLLQAPPALGVVR